MKETNDNMTTGNNKTNIHISSCENWHYSNSIPKELLEKKLIPILNTMSDSICDNVEFTAENNLYADYILNSDSDCTFHLRNYKKVGLIGRLSCKHGRNRAGHTAQWLQIAHSYNLACPDLIAWSDQSDYSSLITKGLGEVTELQDLLTKYSCESGKTLYKEDLPAELSEKLHTSGILAGSMHKAGLLLKEFSTSSIILQHASGKMYLSDLESMQRCIPADDISIYSDTLTKNLSGVAAKIYQHCGEGGLEIFLDGYQQATTSNPGLTRIFYNHIHTAIAVWQAGYYCKVDKLSLHNNEYFQKFEISRQFDARVSLRSRHQKKITVKQWHKVLEPIINSQKLFTSKKLTLKFPDHEIIVNVEGGPQKESIAKWKYGHCLINRDIDTAWPLAMVMYKKQAVLITENLSDNICRDYRNILIVKPSALGDVARAIPVLTALREKYPNSHISWLIRPEFADLVRYHPALNEIILFDKKKFNKLSLAAIRFIGNYSRALRYRKYDLVLDMQGLLRSGLIASKTKAPMRIGYRRARELAWLFYNKRIDTPAINHSNDDCWQIGLAAGINNQLPGFGVPVDKRSYLAAKKILSESGIADNDKFIVLLPGGTADAKIWSPENYGALAKIMFDKYNLKSVIIGAGSHELELSQEISKIAGNKAIVNLVGKTTLSEMTAIMGYSSLVTGNDSGPLHIAAAIPKLVVGIYGPTNPKAVGPVCQLNNVIEAGHGIARIGRYSRNPEHNINNITVQEVLDKLSTLLADK